MKLLYLILVQINPTLFEFVADTITNFIWIQEWNMNWIRFKLNWIKLFLFKLLELMKEHVST